ncbi:MAG: SDR family NAD(P)-dependent oxidoreductase [Proteobacteria bacterium]|nr:SDR family NAD(P)-dependent oxidoreductase [Pseudomonadota bacterium]
MDIAIVTGVSRGLGAALVDEFVAAGMRVIGVGRAPPPPAPRTAFAFVHADLADPLAAAAALAPVFAEEAAAAPRARAVLVNNAAVAEPMGTTGALAADALARSLAINLVAPVLVANAFCAAFADTGRERLVINVTSGLAGRAMPGSGPYSIAKCGMEMLTRALTVDHPEPTFRAITLRPGIIDTPMQQYLRERDERELPDVALFRQWHAEGQLVAPATVAGKTRRALVDAAVEAGRTYNYAEL